MMKQFMQAATGLNHPGITQWKENGGAIVGYSCSYLPAELIHAAGILPIRLRGIETTGMDMGDAYFGPYICSYPKCILQQAAQGGYQMLDGAVITPGCDSMRRLFECWRKAGEDHQGVVPGFFYYFDVPHKTVDHRMKWFVDEIDSIQKAIETHFEVEITVESLHRSIATYNQGRKLMRDLERFRTQLPAPISGTEAFAISIAGTTLPREEFNATLSNFLETLENRSDKNPENPKRLMVIGSISDDLDLIKLIESNEKALVVADNLCFGVRHDAEEIPVTDNPLEALAQSYLGASTCPRMFGQYKERLAILEKKVESYSVDGVILQNIRFCDLHGSENGLFERDLEKQGIPCLKLEREYGPLADTGRLKMRLDAFMERIS